MGQAVGLSDRRIEFTNPDERKCSAFAGGNESKAPAYWQSFGTSKPHPFLLDPAHRKR